MTAIRSCNSRDRVDGPLGPERDEPIAEFDVQPYGRWFENEPGRLVWEDKLPVEAALELEPGGHGLVCTLSGYDIRGMTARVNIVEMSKT